MILNTKKLSILAEEKIANIDITKATVPVTINDNNIEGSTTGTPVTKKYVMSDAFDRSVSYTSQTKTSEQKSIARENIGAASAADLSGKQDTLSEGNLISLSGNMVSHKVPADAATSTILPTTGPTDFGGNVNQPEMSFDSTGHLLSIVTRQFVLPHEDAAPTKAGLMSAADKTKLDTMTAGSYLAEGTLTPADTPVPLTLYEKNNVKIYIQANTLSAVALYITATPAVYSGFLATRSNTDTFQANTANSTGTVIGTFGANDLQSTGGYGHLVIDWSGHIVNFEIMIAVSGSSCLVSAMVLFI